MLCFCNVQAVVTARRNDLFSAVLRASDLNCPDGAPVAWMLRRAGFAMQRRVTGPDLMDHYCRAAAGRNEAIFLLGGTPSTLDMLKRRLLERYPGLRIAGAISPPFRPLSAEENRNLVDAINASGAGTVWIGLGCPKQELWMAENRSRINAVILGVGAAFEFLAGVRQRAPLWMQRCGIEWLHRLWSEPTRLWQRYLVSNCLFVAYTLGEAVRRGHRADPPAGH
jgi:N-acetylglucosaminyldiphosphoundecaprenol N-acetyl-beta-D-mannosaminyltransferase